MDLSVVTTLYQSSRYIEEFYRRISAVATQVAADYEIVFVNDGSPDDSLEVAKRICKSDTKVSVIDLSRNFGQHRAMMTGLENSKGRRVFLIDVDLEELPESLSDFWNAMQIDDEVDIVVGELEDKTMPPFKKLSSDLFYKVFNTLSSTKLSARTTVSRLMSRVYVDALTAYTEKEIFFPAICVDAGFKQEKVRVTKSYDGYSTYTLKKRITMAVEAITSFSSTPLIYIFYLGLIFSISASLFIVVLLLKKIFFGHVMVGWTSAMAALFLVGGIIIFSLGVVGIYVSKIYIEVKARPNSIIRKIYQH